MPKKQASGGKRMSATGKRPSQLWYRPEDYELVRRAALLERRPMSQFALLATLAEAKKLLKNRRPG